MMELRRGLMMGMGANAMVGNLSKYQKIQVTPSSVSDLQTTHTLEVVPKIILISCDETSEPYTVEGYIRHVVVDDAIGACLYHNKGNHNIVIGGYTISKTTSLANAQYYLSDTEIKLHQAGSNGGWSSVTTYTVELYA